VCIPMEEPRPPGEPESEAIPVKSGENGPMKRVFRPAYTSTVTLHDVKEDSLCTVRYGRMPQGDIDGLCTTPSQPSSTAFPNSLHMESGMNQPRSFNSSCIRFSFTYKG